MRSVRSEYKGPSKGSPVSVFGRTRLFLTLYRHPNFKFTLCLFIDRTDLRIGIMVKVFCIWQKTRLYNIYHYDTCQWSRVITGTQTPFKNKLPIKVYMSGIVSGYAYRSCPWHMCMYSRSKFRCKIQKNWCTVTVAPTIEHHGGHLRTLRTRGETRCPGVVSVSCLASRTRNEYRGMACYYIYLQ